MELIHTLKAIGIPNQINLKWVIIKIIQIINMKIMMVKRKIGKIKKNQENLIRKMVLEICIRKEEVSNANMRVVILKTINKTVEILTIKAIKME